MGVVDRWEFSVTSAMGGFVGGLEEVEGVKDVRGQQGVVRAYRSARIEGG